MAVAKRITQETFDEVVQGNIEDFDMETEEAVREAITEFEMQVGCAPPRHATPRARVCKRGQLASRTCD